MDRVEAASSTPEPETVVKLARRLDHDSCGLTGTPQSQSLGLDIDQLLETSDAQMMKFLLVRCRTIGNNLVTLHCGVWADTVVCLSQFNHESGTRF